MLTFYRKGPFVLTARYIEPEVGRIHRDDVVGQFQIQGLKAGPQGEAQKVKVKVRLNLHGVFQVVTATLMEKQVSLLFVFFFFFFNFTLGMIKIIG